MTATLNFNLGATVATYTGAAIVWTIICLSIVPETNL